jgi:glycosyltransferase involved in cell wall biosynthesis
MSRDVSPNQLALAFMTGLSIVIPAYNEQGNIARLLDEAADALSQLSQTPDYEILVIDDGSSDATLAEARKAAEAHPRLRVFAHGRRAGKSAALKTGFDAARGNWVATLDGDGQNDPADLARLWPMIAGGPRDVVYAGARKSRNDGLVKKLTSRFANPLRRALLKDEALDTGCGFKVLPADFARTLPYFDNLHRFIPALARRQGFGVENVLVNDRPRRHGISKYGFFDRAAVSLLDLIGVFWLTRRYSDRGAVMELASKQGESASHAARLRA